jgi:hypothetical protein
MSQKRKPSLKNHLSNQNDHFQLTEKRFETFGWNAEGEGGAHTQP